MTEAEAISAATAAPLHQPFFATGLTPPPNFDFSNPSTCHMEATTNRRTPSTCCLMSPSMVAQSHMKATTSRSTPSTCCPLSPSMAAQDDTLPSFCMRSSSSGGSMAAVGCGISRRLEDRKLPSQIFQEADSRQTIITAHCTCMAGAGEACSHIGATLFAVETIVRIRDSSTCTQKKNRWLPAYTSTVEYKRLREIDFSSARSKKKRLQGCGEEEAVASMRLLIPEPSEDELRRLYDVCSAAERKPAVLMMVEGRNHVFPPPQAREPSTLRGIFTQEALSDTLDKLIERADAFFASFSVSAAMVKFAEVTTRAQSKCPKWYTYRAGRITASTMKSVCSTSVEKLSLSVLKRICYPEDSKFSTPATRWGLDHEEEAVQGYVGKVKSAHANFTYRRAGLYLSTRYPHLAASPDAVVQCDCCGSGLVEVKCPYTQRDSELHVTDQRCVNDSHCIATSSDALPQCSGSDSEQRDVCADPKFCQKRVNGRLSLKHGHMYFYQVQTQMAVCNVEYCDFVVWTTKDIHVERVFRDGAFWSQVLPKATLLFVLAVLPELLSHYFTRSAAPDAEQGFQPSCFCFCRGPESGKMVACDAEGCKFRWFHFTCLGLTRAPKKKQWYCPDCKAAK
ncbi:hypothetical protein ISCGN_015702 [Ixodes scapularis]